MKINILKKCRELAKTSDHPHHKMAAVIVDNKSIISIGTNKLKTHTKAPSPFKYLHCESHAILKAPRKSLKGCEMYIYRITKGNRQGMSKPCKYCLEFIRLSGIKKIYYTMENNWGEIKL